MKMPSELLAIEPQTSLLQFFAHSRQLIEAELDRLIPAESVAPAAIHQAMRWSLFAGGKRFRPALLLAVGEALGAAHEQLLKSACALEMIHTYSLIHDDLPSMDDDDLRRGRATCHVRFGEATATLAGDALQTLAFQTIAEDADLSAETRVRVMSELARGAGTPSGMVAGQAFDLEAESRPVTPAELQHIHQLKTGALIVAAARCGAIIANSSSYEIEVISQYAGHLGLLFQITDDLLDVTASAQDLGKTPGKDERAKKATYPGLFGIEATRARAVKVHKDACSTLAQLRQPTFVLQAIADFILQRKS
jgi:geranylgeranyl diphosphate synthase type II